MKHTADCDLHKEPAYQRGECDCGVRGNIVRAFRAVALAQEMIESGPADESMTAATIALSAARTALERAIDKAKQVTE